MISLTPEDVISTGHDIYNIYYYKIITYDIIAFNNSEESICQALRCADSDIETDQNH